MKRRHVVQPSEDIGRRISVCRASIGGKCPTEYHFVLNPEVSDLARPSIRPRALARVAKGLRPSVLRTFGKVPFLALAMTTEARALAGANRTRRKLRES